MNLLSHLMILAAVGLPFAALFSFGLLRDQRMIPAVLASVAAILAGLLARTDEVIHLNSLMLGTQLGLTTISAPLLAVSGLIWLLALLHEQRSPVTADRARFQRFLLLAMAGNFLALCALDGVTFFLGYALMGLSAAPLIGHRGNRFARRAMSIYLGLTIIGESLLLMAMVHLVAKADSLLLSDLRNAADPTAITLLILALGIKFALPGLHVWIGPAYRAAPTPAVAVLSGGMMNAGILGMFSLLPLGQDGFGTIAVAMIALGGFSAFYAVLMGLAQNHPKSMLAYSSMSQMGVLSLALGVGLYAADPTINAVLLSVLTVYAVHHGLLKGSLFLLIERGYVNARIAVLAGLLGLALAGLPMTSGWWAKAELKSVLESTQVTEQLGLGTVLILSTVATTLLMSRFFLCLWQRTQTDGESRAQPALLMIVAALSLIGLPLWHILRDANLPTLSGGFWVLLGIGLFLLAWTLLGQREFHRIQIRIAPGDVIWPIRRLMTLSITRFTTKHSPRQRRSGISATERIPQPSLIDRFFQNTEVSLSIWPVAGVALIGVLLTLVAGLNLV